VYELDIRWDRMLPFDKVVVEASLLHSFAIEDILNTDVNLDRAVAGARKAMVIGDKAWWDSVAVPEKRGILGGCRAWDGAAESDFCSVNVVTSVQVIVGHELQEILQVGLVGLEFAAHDEALLENIGQAGHDDWIEHVDLQVEPVPNVEAIERHALDKGDAGNKTSLLARLVVPTVTDSEGTINGQVQPENVLGDCITGKLGPQDGDKEGEREKVSPVALSRGPRYST
jgi:hypothetical protein